MKKPRGPLTAIQLEILELIWDHPDGAARVPATLLKAIAWVESTLTMASRSVAFESGGPALVSFDCGHGVMQVTSGMTVPLGGPNRPTASQVNVATHSAHNTPRGPGTRAAERTAAGTAPPGATDTRNGRCR